jgi:hypothetical protein
MFPKRVFFHEESGWLSPLKNHIKEGHFKLQKAQGAMMPNHHSLL